ncbi:MAG: peroxiredoxin [Hyphomicrobium sp.]|nr:peroxiredoxin [Hyphomicrobium sp.]
MSKKLIIIMANTDPRNGEELGAPIFQASVAAAMGYEVEVICTSTAAKLLKKGVAETLKVKSIDTRTVYDFIKEAHGAGVKFFCCSPGLDLFGMHKEDLIPECAGVVGAAHFIEEIMTGESKVLTY